MNVKIKYIPRPILNKLESGFNNNRIIIITGSRQVGKTTAMVMFAKNIPKTYRQFYFNMEDIADLNACSDIDNLSRYLSDNNADLEKDKIFLIIDEFQYINNATKLLKQVYDLYPKTKVLASGSSSIEIQKHLKESLAGRKRVYSLYGLSFAEYLKFKDMDKYLAYNKLKYQSASPVTVEALNKFLHNYLIYGDYPKVVLNKSKQEKIEELQDIYNSYIQKDIKALIKGENIAAYNNLLKVLSSQIGNLLNINELSNTLNIKRLDIENYLTILEQTFIIKLIKPFSRNKRTEISKMPKIYFLDTGIVNYCTGNFSPLSYRQNSGSIIENFILNEILKLKPIYYKLYFWRTKLKSEIDFLLEGNGELIPIEVKWRTMTKPIVPRSIISFAQKYENIKRAVVVTKNFSAEIKNSTLNVYFIPAVLFEKYLEEIIER